ncbi:hypothetical protein DEO72_LG9g2421 [Vigna unguiculata]|uniref:Uncharacterized protein n=1 Tax=Vigna unguiculata TaxID=3917 RepID=A0A4D6N389_VIGUN|nr:hypothetical protein DEO72_LG9g2421 [Vigna unguiculata]
MVPMKVQPIDSKKVKDAVVVRNKSVMKSWLKWLFVVDKFHGGTTSDTEMRSNLQLLQCKLLTVTRTIHH